MALTPAQRNLRTLAWRIAGYEPSPDGQKPFHDSLARFKLMAGGVGAGKSFATAMEIVAYFAIPNAIIWLVGPNYDLAKPEFEYLLDLFLKMGFVDPASITNSSRGARKFRFFSEFGGATCETKSSNEMATLAGVRPHVFVVCEAAQHVHEILSKAYERTAQERGPVIFSGTFEGSYGWYADQWLSWQGPNPEGGQSFSIPTWTNTKVYPGGRNDPEILRLEKTMPPDVFQERFGGVPCPPVGLVFKEFTPRFHVKPLSELYNPDLPVEIWADPATHTYPVLFVQPQADGKTFHVLDEVYAKDQIAQEVIPQVIAKPFWKSVTSGVMDIAGKTRAMGGQSQLEVWSSELARLKEHSVDWFVHKWPQEEKRNAIHLRLWSGEGHSVEGTGRSGGPLLYFSDSLNQQVSPDGRANGIIGELKTYRWAQKGEMVSDPRHPIKKNEDAISALGYGLLRHHGPVIQRPPRAKSVIRRYF